MKDHHTLTVTAQDRPGVISQIGSLLRRKQFNIASMTAGNTHIDGYSALTIVIIGDRAKADQAALQIKKIIEVTECHVLDDPILREIAFARFTLETDAQKSWFEAKKETIFCEIIQTQDNTLTLEIIDKTRGILNFLDELKSQGITIHNWIRSGVIGIERGL